MATLPDKKPVNHNFELAVRVENLSLTPFDNDLVEVSAQFIIYGFGKSALKKFGFCVNPKHFPEEPLEKILESMKEHLAASLVTACRANLFESIFHSSNIVTKEKKDARKVILKMFEKDFNERNQIPKGSKKEVTSEQIFNEGVDAWIKLEKDLKKTVKSPKKSQLAVAWGIDEQLLTYYIRKFPIFLDGDALKDSPNKSNPIGQNGFLYKPKPTYKTFLNLLRFYKEQKSKKD